MSKLTSKLPAVFAIVTPVPPVKVIVSPRLATVGVVPSVKVMSLFVSFAFSIEPASIAFVIPRAFTCNASVSISIELSSTFTERVGV